MNTVKLQFRTEICFFLTSCNHFVLFEILISETFIMVQSCIPSFFLLILLFILTVFCLGACCLRVGWVVTPVRWLLKKPVCSISLPDCCFYSSLFFPWILSEAFSGVPVILALWILEYLTLWTDCFLSLWTVDWILLFGLFDERILFGLFRTESVGFYCEEGSDLRCEEDWSGKLYCGSVMMQARKGSLTFSVQYNIFQW